ncbi:hypothetical protein P167DRAFT_412932 [Morchella conica CCBAS932]|uniref:Uncharacterized protein n=1 Tax=Morchella conica CCBAS932 TaxID=1392247 RepID=A0A3N4KYW6_9PEZI|nr:hypothetical protein P167DRAFT_412932 [Morchella conica CCBAS932]
MAHPGRVRPFFLPFKHEYSNLSCHPVWIMIFLHSDVYIPPMFTNSSTLNFSTYQFNFSGVDACGRCLGKWPVLSDNSVAFKLMIL